jgi:hypothetical protein
MVRKRMLANGKLWRLLITICCLAVGPIGGKASALTVDIARKCEAITAKAFPPRVPGNPAAGSAKGSGRDEQDYFRKCVEKNGKMEDDSTTQSK